ncbi:hypothetical protein K6Q96_03945 [Grimontia kaedaensis]|uniref:Uncharacterized protein n=1 Tax=Grimontia kaedaensis TaxID=2872157 RepID=A0ABY4WU97_9GAMM|nr:hypothetical protein [Grimontia kaedaensis]USH03176.1 hypothetical protein K6Q96_03945 [Grimontia kaedaensis]
MREETNGRRKFLKGLMGVGVVVAGGTVYRAVDNGVFSVGKGDPFTPWTDWQSASKNGELAIINAAVLAANPHNTQPWIFELRDNAIFLYADTSRHLGTMDVYGRELCIGLGCAVENMIQAAPAFGFDAKVLLGDTDLTNQTWNGLPMHVATISLTPTSKQEQSELYQAIGHRHTDRSEYLHDKPIDTSLVSALNALAKEAFPDVSLTLLTNPAQRQAFTQQTVNATRFIATDHQMSADSFQWFRLSHKDMQAHRDGVYIDTAGLPPAITAISKIMPPLSEESSNQYWIDGTQRTMASTPMHGLLTLNNLYSSKQNIEAGRLWQRIHLWATTQGISMQPVNQTCEVVDRQRQLGQPQTFADDLRALSGKPQSATFAFRAGYPTQTAIPSPRRALKDVVSS